jgi:AraC-like DNA-binding protein/mannose-6-phosphate isomerase-like protein (cupin superfamily)
MEGIPNGNGGANMHTAKVVFRDNLDLKFQWGNMIVNVLCIAFQPANPTWNVKLHAHSSYELHFIPAGRGTLRVGKETYPIASGVFYLTGPDVYHQQETDPDDPMCEYSLNFEVKQYKSRFRNVNDFVQGEVEQLFGTFERHPFWFGRDTQHMTDHCREIIDELSAVQPGCYSAVQNLVSQIIIKAARNITEMSAERSVPSDALPRKIIDDRRRNIVDDFFRNPVRKNKSPVVLAERIGVSVRQLNRIIQEYYGMTFTDKLKHHRIEHAKLLLISTDLSVKKIAHEVGFTDPGYFHKVFKESVRSTPQEYKARSGK